MSIPARRATGSRPYGETTSSAPARISLSIEAFSEARATIRRPGLSARAVRVMYTLAASESTAHQAPGALDASLPEHGLVGRVARGVPDTVFPEQRLQLRLRFDHHRCQWPSFSWPRTHRGVAAALQLFRDGPAHASVGAAHVVPAEMADTPGYLIHTYLPSSRRMGVPQTACPLSPTVRPAHAE